MIRALVRFQSISRVRTNLCFYSSTTNKNFINISTDNNTNVTTLTLNRPPVNSLNFEFLNQLIEVFNKLKEIKPNGVIITSFSDKVFSAGLDITELYRPDEKKFRIFWRTVQDVMLTLYGFPYPTVAVLNGDAPAGGCLIALCSDYRIMVDDFTIGLNEVLLGIAVPPWLVIPMCNTIGRRNAELALTTGKLFKTKEALEIGLVDEVASNKADAMDKAMDFLNRHKTISSDARKITKSNLREPHIEFIKKTREQDLENSVALIMRPDVQHNMGIYFNKIRKK